MLCKRESESCYKQSLRLRMRSKILTANPKYHYSYLFFYRINKGDLPLIYSCVFWCEFINLVGFFRCHTGNIRVTYEYIRATYG